MTVDCPTCGKECATKNGMKNHHSQIHGESLSRREYTCFICKDTFERHQSQMENQERNFCSVSCRAKWQSDNWRGEDNHNYECGQNVEVECVRCDFTFFVYPSYAKDKYKWNGEGDCTVTKCGNCINDSGYRTHVPFGKNWAGQREKARERDGNQCVVCGMDNEEHLQKYGKALHVHHKISRHEFIEDGELDYEEANKLENLITLCATHHRQIESGTIDL